MSFNSNIRSKINALNNNAKANSVSSKPNIKVSNSISEKIKKLSSSNDPTPVLGNGKKSSSEDKQLKDVKNQSSSIKTKEDEAEKSVPEAIETIVLTKQDSNQDEPICDNNSQNSNDDLNGKNI